MCKGNISCSNNLKNILRHGARGVFWSVKCGWLWRSGRTIADLFPQFTQLLIQFLGPFEFFCTYRIRIWHDIRAIKYHVKNFIFLKTVRYLFNAVIHLCFIFHLIHFGHHANYWDFCTCNAPYS